MKDFELCGISKIKIRQELNLLIYYNMIEWNEEKHLFRIKPSEEWKAPFHGGFDPERGMELVKLNLQHSLENE
jgi:hypothetical protein